MTARGTLAALAFEVPDGTKAHQAERSRSSPELATIGKKRRIALQSCAILAVLAGCAPRDNPAIPALATSASNLAAQPRGNGAIGSPALPPPQVSYGSAQPAGAPGRASESTPGNFSLDFADTDIREVVAQVLGGLLHKTYTIDPNVRGNVTLHTAQPLNASQLLPTLGLMLGNAGAVLAESEGVYRVVPVASAGAAGSVVQPLRYVSAEELAKVLQPVAGTNAKVTAETGLNALLISGDPAQVESLRAVVRSFDVDSLANQSYALLPVSAGNAKDFADAMQEAFRGRSGASLSGLVQVIPLGRLNAVLIISSQPRYIDAARRVFALVERERRNTARSWNVFYLQNSNANDIAYTLQMAFTPNNVTAQPEPRSARGAAAGSMQGAGATGLGSGGQSGASGLGSNGGLGGGFGGGSGGGLLSGGSAGASSPAAQAGGFGASASRSAGGGAAQAPVTANPLLGGLEQGGGQGNSDDMRILPNAQNNAVLIYGTPQENETVSAMLRKIDIVPMQVRIDATIAEVTLNDTLKYGTQFYFKSGGINGILGNASTTLNTAGSAALNAASFPGFFLGGSGGGGAPFAISALQAVTTVNVLSSPQLTVVDNQVARLQVGALVPYLTGTAQSTLTSTAPIVNSIAYQQTGVIMEVTPRVNAGGLITLDISQEVSDVDSTTTTTGLNSPTFNERSVTSRVVVQDGQTIGLAGLIQDSISKGNQGLPWLKDIPVLGLLAGTQNNARTRTELLVLLTPHVIRDQSDMRKLTEDMREALIHAAAVPTTAAAERLSGSSDPGARLREKVRRGLERP